MTQPSPRREKPWTVTPEGLVMPSGNRMKAGCHHRSGKEIACGGCYARLYLALTMIQAEEGDPFDIACAVFDAMKSESRRVRP
jgi:hypothetical protein